MQTSLPESFLQTATGKAADEILRNCVHCGFCNATCPTYQLTGDELDGPRGRIYLMKQALEGQRPSSRTLLHLDRCLTCRACETTCPSGVDYHLLLDTGRDYIEQRVRRPLAQRLVRRLLRLVLTSPRRFTPLLRMAQAVRPVLPARLTKSIPIRAPGGQAVTSTSLPRTMLLLDGCVQPALAPQINRATQRVLAALGINAVIPEGSGCCGALSHHLTAAQEARGFMKTNIDAWWPLVEAGAEAIVISASGCAPMVKDYGRLLADDHKYAGKAARISELARDLSEVVSAERPEASLKRRARGRKIAFHSPCSLQHGQQITGVVEDLLVQSGYTLAPVADTHLCCGSAGSYSILQPALAGKLRSDKLEALQADHPSTIATANIGCLTHMAGHARVPVRHWIELLEPLFTETP